MGFHCWYRDPARHDAQGLQSDASSLENRMDAIERLLHNFLAGFDHGPSDVSNTRQPSTMYSPLRSACNARPSKDGAALVLSSDSVDGMCSITFAGECTLGHFGPTSTSAFFKCIGNTMNEIRRTAPFPFLSVSQSTEPPHFISRPCSPPAETQTADPPPWTTPDRGEFDSIPPWDEAVALVDGFFANTGSLFPYLCRTTVLESLTSIQEDREGIVSGPQICIINMVLAFAMIHSSSAVPLMEHMGRADQFFRRSLSILAGMHPLDATLESVQALLLLAQYVQGTQRSAQTWTFVNAAIERAVEMGLFQSSGPHHRGISPVEAEMRRRTWWMCFMMDRMCSMTFGRPPLIPNSHMNTMELPLDFDLDDLIPASKPSLEGGPSRNTSDRGVFLSTSKLNVILGQVIERLYGNNLEGSAPMLEPIHLQAIVEIEHNLEEWMAQLPPDLSLLCNNNILQGPAVVHDLSEQDRFPIILTLRYHSVRMLLHRTVLQQCLRGPSSYSTTYTQSIWNCSIDACVNSALVTIRIISKASHKQILLPIWWYSVYYVLSSSLVLFSAILLSVKYPTMVLVEPLPELIQTIQMAHDAAGTLASGTWLGVRCKKALQRLVSIVQSMPGHGASSDHIIHGHTLDSSILPLDASTMLSQIIDPVEQAPNSLFLFPPDLVGEDSSQTHFAVGIDQLLFNNRCFLDPDPVERS
ncbi:hypothetical protein FE257_007994 [Aspergillus nanangensis]|uniref:Xylanolytic transcriptional activator regulatory domain-containing protein n=1 Tax=Aspergillus nanangensis TaxID=2582783 RepID=A0AAD4GTS9_ASPNN|nr:hypothetical protein FE257_007994 [Aspergillus nanangensis]